MLAAGGASSPETLNWLPVGDPPETIAGRQEARMKRLLPYFTVSAGLLVGGLAGLGAIVIVYGGSWPIPAAVELYFVVAIPVGVASFFFQRFFIPWVVRAGTLKVRRVAVSRGELHIEDKTGRAMVVTLKRVKVTPLTDEPGWMSVTISGGRVSPFFYVPMDIGTIISGALPG